MAITDEPKTKQRLSPWPSGPVEAPELSKAKLPVPEIASALEQSSLPPTRRPPPAVGGAGVWLPLPEAGEEALYCAPTGVQADAARATSRMAGIFMLSRLDCRIGIDGRNPE